MSDLKLELTNGRTIVCDSVEDNPDGVSFIKVLGADGKEIAYWTADEWEEEPILVMGAIMGALAGSSLGGHSAN